jgi:hypothetical protein
MIIPVETSEYTKWLFDQSVSVVIAVAAIVAISFGIRAVYRDWMGRDSFAKDFFKQHARMADATVEQVAIQKNLVQEMSGMKDEMSGMKDQIANLEGKVGDVQQGLGLLTTEVKNHPPTQ